VAEGDGVAAVPVETAEEMRTRSWNALWAETRQWSAYALRHQLTAMGEEAGEEVEKDALVGMYWNALCKVGKHSDADARRFLITASEKPPVEEIARLWIACVVGSPLPEGSLRAALRSGVLLCGLVNGLRRGIVPKVATDEQTASMAMESKRNAKMRENIGQYIDACAELGLSQRELFLPDDLFEDKNFPSVLKNIEGLSRLAQGTIPGYVGPLIGKKFAYKKEGGLTFSSAPRVVLAGGRGGAYQGAVSGRGNM